MVLICPKCNNKNFFIATQVCEQVVYLDGNGKFQEILSVPTIFSTKDIVCPNCETPIELTEEEKLRIGE